VALHYTPRQYQLDGVNEIARRWTEGKRRVLYTLIAGGGKSTVASLVTERALANGASMLVMAHRRQLIKQMAERMMLFDIPYRIEMANLPNEPWVRNDPNPRVYIASKDTLISRCRGGNWDSIPNTTLAVYDECHHVSQSEYSELAARCPAKWWLGLTATPMNPDGSALGSRHWDVIVSGPSYKALLDQGFLVPLRVHTAKRLGERRKSGDAKTGIAGDPLGHWKRLGEGRPTLGFTPNVAEARFIADEFNRAGIPAAVLSCQSSFEERTEVLGRLADGKLLWVGNAFLLGEGVDIPELGCIQLLRKCNGLRDYIQLVSRVLRACPRIGKTDGLLLDHSGAHMLHRYPEIEFEWFLDETAAQFKQRVKEKKEKELAPAFECLACGCVFAGRPTCPHCGEPIPPSRKRKKPVVERELLTSVECKAGLVKKSQFQRTWEFVLGVAKANEWPLWRANGMFRGRTQVYPWEAGVYPVFRRDQNTCSVRELLCPPDSRI
jgi:superfamily II DNA or RNA helicase